MSDTDALTFATRLLGQGIEFVLRRNGRLHLWPAKAYNHLPDDDKAFIREHRDELKELAASKALPETTVVWQPPGTVMEPEPPVAAPVGCAYCGRPCVGREHSAFAVLHYDDPAEVARRDTAATAVMRKMVRFAWYGGPRDH